MKATFKIERPTLARGVRYRWDPVRAEHHLLFPEGMLVLNDTGAATVRLCDGRSLEEIQQTLRLEFGDETSAEEVREFLHRLSSRGLICHADS